MNRPTPAEAVQGTVLVLVPHFDDEILGCGGTLAGIADKGRVHIVYATSGRGSENLSMPGVRVDASIDMGKIRRQESVDALSVLGVSAQNVTFLDVPDYKVAAHAEDVRTKLGSLIRRLKPDVVLLPFRYDRHRDHVALSRIGRRAVDDVGSAATVLEYFIYYRWKLLPRRDVRAYCRPECLVSVDIEEHTSTKAAALRCFTSQTTLYFPWQTRPVLSERLIDEVSRGPEVFAKGEIGDERLFTLPLFVIRLVHVIEPVLKRMKDRLSFLVARLRGRTIPSDCRP